MARPPQFNYPEADSLSVAKAKQVLKELSPEGRAFVLAWLVKYYNDNGGMFSPQVSSGQRRRVTIDGTEFWLVHVPRK